MCLSSNWIETRLQGACHWHINYILYNYILSIRLKEITLGHMYNEKKNEQEMESWNASRLGKEEMSYPVPKVRRYIQKGQKRIRREGCHGGQGVDGISSQWCSQYLIKGELKTGHEIWTEGLWWHWSEIFQKSQSFVTTNWLLIS